MIETDNTDSGLSGYLQKYGYTISLRRRDWAWEFLRRNREFIREAYPTLPAVQRSPSCISGGKVIHLKEPQHVADRWGLLYCPNPDLAAPKADVFWAPEKDPCVVPMMVSPRSLHEKDEMFAEVMEACTIDVLEDAYGCEHLITRSPFSTTQSMCFGVPILSGQSVKLSLHPQSPEHIDLAYNAYKRAKAVLHEGPWKWTERTLRLRNALICLDVKEAGLSLRNAGEIIFGEERVADEWAHNKSMRDRVRSYYRSGCRIRDYGYLQLLKSSPIDPAEIGV